MPHDRESKELSVSFENFSEDVSEAEVALLESSLGNLIQAVLLTGEEGVTP